MGSDLHPETNFKIRSYPWGWKKKLKNPSEKFFVAYRTVSSFFSFPAKWEAFGRIWRGTSRDLYRFRLWLPFPPFKREHIYVVAYERGNWIPGRMFHSRRNSVWRKAGTTDFSTLPWEGLLLSICWLIPFGWFVDWIKVIASYTLSLFFFSFGGTRHFQNTSAGGLWKPIYLEY